MLIVKRSNFIFGYFFCVSFNSEPRKDQGIYDMLSGECSYTFGFGIGSLGQVWWVEIGSVLWSLPRMESIFWVLVEVIPSFVKVSPLRGSRILRYWLVARPAFCEFPLLFKLLTAPLYVWILSDYTPVPHKCRRHRIKI